MECGESMVAVVQGLRDSALSVTLVTSKQLKNSLKARRLPTTRCTRETNTEYVKQNASTQISDERYATTYQLAHCRHLPVLPQQPRELSPQRDEQRLSNGNFKVKKYDVGVARTNSSPMQTFRRTTMRSSQGFLGSSFTVYSASSSPSRQEDVFIQSLRRYPLSPERSESAELVQRLLNYTQTKHLSKNCSRSTRSLCGTSPPRSKVFRDTRHLSKSRETKDLSKSSKIKGRRKTKDTETNSRILDSFLESGSKTTRQAKESRVSKKNVDNETDGTANKNMQTYTRNVVVVPIQSSTKCKNDQLSESYNYLKATSSGRRRNIGRCRAELRYLNEIKRFLHDCVSSDENRAVCSSMMNRYNQHKKICPQHKNDMSTDGEAQADEPSTSKGLPGYTYCKPPLHKSCSTVDRYIQHRNIICPEHKNETTQSSRLINRMPCSCKMCLRNQSAVSKLTGDVLNFIKKLSTYADESPGTVGKTNEMIQQLAVQLINLNYQQESEDIAKENIWKCMGKLPQWFPGTEHDWKMLKDLIADKILSESYDIASLTVDDVNKIEEVIREWLKELSVYTDNTPESHNKREEFVKRLATSLNNLKNRADFDKTAKDEINIYIDSLPKWFSSAEHDQIAENLLNNIKIVMTTSFDQRKAYDKSVDATTENEIEEQILEWLEELPFYPNETPKNKAQCKEIVQKLASKLNSLKSRESFEYRAKDEIDKCIESLPTWFSSAERDQIADNLLNNIKDTMRTSFDQRRANSIKVDDTLREVEEQTLEWLNQLPEFVNETPQNKAKSKVVIKKFVAKLNSLQGRDSFKKRAKGEIDKCIESLPLWFPGNKSEQAMYKNKIAENLLNDLNYVIGESNSGEDVYGNEIEEQTLEWLEELPFFADETPKNKAQCKEIVIKLACNLNSLKSCHSFDDRAKEEIVECLESLPFWFSSTERDQIADNLLNNLKNTMKKSYDQRRPNSKKMDVADKEVEEQTLERLNQLPDSAGGTPKNKTKSKEMVKKITAKLKSINGHDSYEVRAKDETQKCIEKIQFPGTKLHQLKLTNQTADNLLYDFDDILVEDEDISDNNIEEQTLQWLNEIPTYADETPQKKAKCQEIVRKLADKLKNLKGCECDNYEKIAKNEIDKCIESLPLRFPGNKSEQEMLKNQIAKFILDDVNNVVGISLHQRRASDKVEHDEKPISEEQILDLLKEVCVYDDLSQKNKEKIGKMATDLATKLKSIKGHTDFDKNAQEMIKKYIASVVSLISNDIAENISDYSNIDETSNLKETIGKSGLNKGSKNKSNATDNKINERILDWLSELPAYAGATPQNKAKSEEIVKKLVNDLGTLRGLDDCDKRANEKIQTCIESLPLRLPGTKKNQDVLKKQFAKNLFDIVGVDDLKNQKGIWGKSFYQYRDSKNGVHDINNEEQELLKKPITDIVNADELKNHKRTLAKSFGQCSRDCKKSVGVINNKGAEQIQDFLKELPAYSNTTPQNNFNNEKIVVEMIKQLANDLETLKGLYDFDKRANDEIKKCIESLPLSLPNNKQTQDVLKKHKRDNLFGIVGVDEIKNEQVTLGKSFSQHRYSKTTVHDTDKKEQDILKKQIPDFVLKNLKETLAKSFDECRDYCINGVEEFPHKSFNLRTVSNDMMDATNKNIEKQTSERNSKQDFTTSTPHKNGHFTFPKKISIIKRIQPQMLHDEDEFTHSGKDEEKYLQMNPAASTSKCSKLKKFENKEDKNESPNVVTEVEDLISKWTEVIHPKLASPVQKNQGKKTSQLFEDISMRLDSRGQSRIRRDSIPDPVKKEAANVPFEDTEGWREKLPIDEHGRSIYKQQFHESISESLPYKVADIPFDDIEDWSETFPINEHGRKIYKQQLIGAISKTLPFQELSADEEISFEVLKDDVASAFIDLHYVGNNEEKKIKHKKKINDAIDKYCNDYLKKHPTTPIDREKLNLDLYTALKNTLESNNKSFRNELELEMQQEPCEHYIVPPCTLSAEDRAYLDKIRERSRLRQVSHVDATSQTKIRCTGPGICTGLRTCPSLELHAKQGIAQRSSGVQTSSLRTQAAGSQVDLCPDVIVREYYWDSNDTYMEPQTRAPSAPCPASFAHPCESMPKNTISQPKNDIIISQRPSSFSPPSNLSPSETQKSQPCRWYSTSPSQHPMSEKINLSQPAREYTGLCSGSRDTDQNLTQSQLFVPEEKNQNTIPTASSIPEGSIPQAGPCGSHRWTPCSAIPRQPWYIRQDVPSTPEQYEAGPSCFSRMSRVTHLGSFDDMEPTVNSRSYASGKCPKNGNNFRDESYTRYLPIDKDSYEPYVNEEYNIESVKCRCKERILTKCSGRKIIRNNVRSRKSCGKCCGVYCAYPSNIIFR